MLGWLTAAFIAIPILEIWLLLAAGRALGAGWTIAAIVATGVAGAALARHQGFAAVDRVREALRTGRDVGPSVVAAALVLVAAVLLLLPGFATDAVGFALLVPPVRGALARAIAARLRQRAGGGLWVDLGGAHAGGQPCPEDDREDDDRPPPGVIDV